MHSIAELDERLTSRFSTPASKLCLNDSPTLGKFSLGHASDGLRGDPSAVFVWTAIKELLSDETKLSRQIHIWNIVLRRQ